MGQNRKLSRLSKTKQALLGAIGLSKTLTLGILIASPSAFAALEDDIIGDWKLVSHLASFQGESFDSHKALLSQRPCAANITYVISKDKRYRLDASASGCDEAYKKIQEKIYAKTQWKLVGNTITTSATNFAVGQSYTVTVEGKRMIWVGQDNQGTLTYERK